MKKFLSCLIIFTAFCLSDRGFADSPQLKATLARLAAVKGVFTFAVFGDNRSGDRVYKKIIHQMMLRDPLFAINTGDLIPQAGNREEWANFKEVSKQITVPYFWTPGNHDIEDKQSAKVWREEADLPGNEFYYSFVVGKNLFVILNSCDPENEKKIVGKQFEWLKNTLNPAKYDHQFVILHHPLYLPSKATHRGDSVDKYPALRDELHKLFVEKKVNMVIAGHEHTYNRMEKNGVTYVISGGAGAPLYGRDSFNSVMIVEVDGPHVGAKVIDREGSLRDEFSFSPSPHPSPSRGEGD